MDLKRQVYERMLSWKRQAGHSTLEVSGARQVGKTYIVNQFADREYKHKVMSTFWIFPESCLLNGIMTCAGN